MPPIDWAFTIDNWLNAHDPEDTEQDAQNYLNEVGKCECCGVYFTEYMD